ncbi:hypothetical protein SNE25_21465 [Mucilaginibacter sabulilitoris]|uniref:Right handed beta helix domain-containing protein n=1 Tax=Mucilaginibacter sabulilitoris TaxID=1173583 RepID=A0ABZ0TFD5_9SPHI|nr:hypothetical protein [Mucilaginibacter sabulilitoris]WPU91889.1 hypothetical protein SNE25_21465 [Mucilaginibacter sabulilitoris]
MNSVKYLTFVILLILSIPVSAQTLYVDISKGRDDAPGTLYAPLTSLEQAVSRANKFSGNEPITIRIAPGLYTITEPLLIHQESARPVATKYTFQAAVMPDDTGWTPSKMPVIQCVADSNRKGNLKHASIAFQIERNQVVIKGLKFIGNPNPASQYYYVVERRDSTLTGLEISQCYFIGEKNCAPMQGGVFAQGAGIHIDHCIFWGAKNAVLAFLGLADFSLTHSIIYGAYEGAVWYGYGQSSLMPFTFTDNIIADGNYFWVGYRGIHRNYKFSHSLISGNVAYMGFNEEEIVPDLLNKPIEKQVRKSGKVILNEITIKGQPKDYLNLSPTSAGRDIDAGIFKQGLH